MSQGSEAGFCPYNTEVEIFMALKDVDLSYMFSNKGEIKVSPTLRKQQITVFWKPPGTVQWLEKYKTEVLPGKSNLQFTALLTTAFESKDAGAVYLRFEIRHVGNNKVSPPTPGTRTSEESLLWSTVQVNLESILRGGAKGLELPLTLDFGFSETSYFAAETGRIRPGSLFLRGEILHPCDFGIMLQFGLQSDKTSSSDYYIELHKLNEDNAFEVSHPYTLLYRSELQELLTPSTDSKGREIYFSENRVSNGDLDRVLKIDVYKKESMERKGFALTTLGSLLKDQIQVLDVDRVDKFHPHPVRKVLGLLQKEESIKIILNLISKVPSPRISSYFQQGWKIVPVFAIDYSRPTWNVGLHNRSLISDSNVSTTPFEEALELTALSIHTISACTSAMFYGFGYKNDSFMNVYRLDSRFVSNTLKNYHDGACLTLMSSLHLKQGMKGHETSTGILQPSTSLQYGSTSGQENTLTILLNDLASLITARTNALEYFSVVVFTNDQYLDPERHLMALKELSILPVSIIFVGIGLGDFRLFVDLENSHTRLHGIAQSRKFVHIIHFRNRHLWDSVISRENYKSSPTEIFNKEIHTSIHEHTTTFFKKFFLDVNRPISH